jgi:hypothetical protein
VGLAHLIASRPTAADHVGMHEAGQPDATPARPGATTTRRREQSTMPIIEVLVVLCLISDPVTCRDEHISFVEATTLEACMEHAQPYLGQWSARYAGWRIRSWRCQWIVTGKRDA